MACEDKPGPGPKSSALQKKRILSGMRPTGKMHLGNYYGALYNWMRLQEDYQCYYFVADWHALTTEYETPQAISGFIPEMVTDWLSVGLDPLKSTIFVQSAIPEHCELYLVFGMVTPVPWLERNPTYKDQMEQLAHKDLATHGFLGYPVLQAADILMYKADGVPVGVDQVPHVEMTREIARRFNHLYRPIFPEPEALLTEIPKLTGHRRPQDEQKLWQLHLPERPAGGDGQTGASDDHRYPAALPERSRRTGPLPGLPFPSAQFAQRAPRGNFHGMPGR